MNPKISISPPSVEQLDTVKGALAWFNDVLQRGFGKNIELVGTRDDIPTLHSLLAKGPFGENAEAELKMFGMVFGTILITEMPLKWVLYKDEYGTDLALQYRDLEVYTFPIDMILKRVEAGEEAGEINLSRIMSDLRRTLEEQSVAIRGPGAGSAKEPWSRRISLALKKWMGTPTQ